MKKKMGKKEETSSQAKRKVSVLIYAKVSFLHFMGQILHLKLSMVIRLIDRVEYKQGDTGRQLCQLINVDVLSQSPVPFQLPSSFSGIPAAGCVYIHTRDHGEPFLTANNGHQEQE